MPGLVDIAPLPPVPLRDLLTYGVPDSLRARIQPGMRVRIPLGPQTRTGVITGFAEAAPQGPLRAILDVLDDPEPFLSAEVLELCRWTARYYLTPLAEVIATIVPVAVPPPAREQVVCLARRLTADELGTLARRAPARAQAYRALSAAPDGELSPAAARTAGLRPAVLRGLVAAGLARALVREPAVPLAITSPTGPRPVLTPAQAAAARAIMEAGERDGTASFVLHGVTGSGKTEVFLTAAEHCLAAGRDVLLLVPEIALTHQIVDQVRTRLGSGVAVLHSGLGPRERWREWRRIRSGEARIVIGARSAVFAPMRRLGLVVVDEEHDAAYKQADGLRYNARDLAVVRARLAAAIVVLASATPSAESYQAALDGRHTLLQLPERPTAHPLPPVEVVDLRSGPHRTNVRLLSDDLRTALEANLARGGQTLILLNRRGFATYLQCPACGSPVSCPHCSVTLTWHRSAGAVVCHHCHHRRRPPATCPECQRGTLEPFGVGTEQIEATLRACYPLAAVDRLDRDAAQRLGAQRRILRDWRAGTTDILVGTQMVSKGHDVPGVTLVAVLLADLSLHVPDFRAAERTLQLLVQVAGRAGRGAAPGRVVVQTFRPGHPSVAAVTQHDYVGFMAGELERRRALGYPPFTRLINVRVDGTDSARVEDESGRLADELRARGRGLGLGESAILGPAPAPLTRVRGRYRWQTLLRSADVRALRALARTARAAEVRMRRARLRLAIDVDPYSLL